MFGGHPAGYQIDMGHRRLLSQLPWGSKTAHVGQFSQGASCRQRRSARLEWSWPRQEAFR